MSRLGQLFEGVLTSEREKELLDSLTRPQGPEEPSPIQNLVGNFNALMTPEERASLFSFCIRSLGFNNSPPSA